MTGAKQILLAGFAAALSLLVSACHTTVTGPELAAESPLVVSSVPPTSASYLADYTQDGALPFTCEVMMRSDDMIRRDYTWQDDKGAARKVSIVINGDKAVRIENGKTTSVEDSDTVMARFFAGLVLSPAAVISSADRSVRSASGADRYVYWVRLNGVSGVESCIVNTDPKSRLWTGLKVRMAAGQEVSTVFPEYKTISNVTYPSRLVSSTGDGAPVQCIIRDVKINPELPDELFRLPDSNG